MTVETLLYFFLVVVIFAIVWWGMGQLPLPPIARTVIIVVMSIIAVLFLFGLLTGSPFIRLR